MKDEYSDIQTDQITEIFKRAIASTIPKRLDTRGEFAWHVLKDVIWELEQERAMWPDVRMLFHYQSNKYRQIPLGEEVR